jgi:hypothetical protein
VTATTSPEPAPASDPREGQTVAALWTLVLILGIIVAFLGVSAAVGSAQRKQYAEARVGAVFFARNGNAIGTSMQRLEVVNARDYSLVRQTHAALEAGDMSLFNRLVAQAEVNNVEQQRLQQEVRDFQAGFDKAFRR